MAFYLPCYYAVLDFWRWLEEGKCKNESLKSSNQWSMIKSAVRFKQGQTSTNVCSKQRAKEKAVVVAGEVLPWNYWCLFLNKLFTYTHIILHWLKYATRLWAYSVALFGSFVVIVYARMSLVCVCFHFVFHYLSLLRVWIGVITGWFVRTTYTHIIPPRHIYIYTSNSSHSASWIK